MYLLCTYYLGASPRPARVGAEHAAAPQRSAARRHYRRFLPRAAARRPHSRLGPLLPGRDRSVLRRRQAVSRDCELARGGQLGLAPAGTLSKYTVSYCILRLFLLI